MIEFVIVLCLFEYFDVVLWQYQQEMFEVFVLLEKFSKEDVYVLGVFLCDLVVQDLLDVQVVYSELFDCGWVILLLLFEYVYGEFCDCGQVMVDFMVQYECYGLLLDSYELLDYLLLYLEYLVQLLEEEVFGGLWDVVLIFGLFSVCLQQCESCYVVLFELLLKLVNIQVDSQKVVEKIVDEVCDDMLQVLDVVWEEEQVKFFVDQGCGELEIFVYQCCFVGVVVL